MSSCQQVYIVFIYELGGIGGKLSVRIKKLINYLYYFYSENWKGMGYLHR